MEIQIVRSARRTISLELRGDTLLVRAPRRATQGQIQEVIARHRRWLEAALARQEALRGIPPLSPGELEELTRRARAEIPARVAYYAPLVGVDYGRITVRKQRSRWGSCSAQGNLSFNCLLMLAPPQVLDSVVVHELCHRREMNHSPRFYRLVEAVFPDYPACRRWLKEHGPALMARLPGKEGGATR